MNLSFIGNKDENGIAWTCTLIRTRTRRKEKRGGGEEEGQT
jgi:hypothetical protein